MSTGSSSLDDPTRRSLRAEQVEATRRAVVRSARRLFGTDGYAATSVDDIARDARVTKGAVYHHFATKEELFRAVYAEVEADAQRRTTSSVRPAGATPIDVVVDGMHAYLDAALDPEVQRITLIDGPVVLGAEPEGPAEEQHTFRGLRDYLAVAVQDGAILPVDPGALAHMIRGACLQGGLIIARATDHDVARRHVGTVLEAMIRGLGPGERVDRGPARRRTTTRRS